jgi:hypothetical protein
MHVVLRAQRAESNALRIACCRGAASIFSSNSVQPRVVAALIAWYRAFVDTRVSSGVPKIAM